MIGPLSVAVALQLAAAAPLVVRTPTATVRVPTIATAAGRMVSVDALGRVMPIHATRDSASWYTLEAWDSKLSVETGAATIRVGEEIRPLASPATLRGGALLIPVQLVSEIFPDALPNVRWDAKASQLVLFTGIAATASAVNNPRSAASAPADPDVPAFVPARGGALPAVRVKGARHLVVVDAGHGGVDNGMTGPLGGGPKIYEKNITLAVSKKLGAQLAARGVDVVYTRTTDTLIALDDRGRIANKTRGDLFISIHVNAANPSWKNPGGSRGFETYFLSEARTEDARRVEHMENDAARFETVAAVDRNDPLSFILSDMQQNEHLRESSELAEIVQARLARMHPGTNRGVKQAGFRVLVTAFMPAVLVEIGFGTNPREAQYLSASDKQEALAKAIADAAMEYLEGHDERVRGSHSDGVVAGNGPR